MVEPAVGRELLTRASPRTSDLLRQARTPGVNLSQLLEQWLSGVLRAERECLWLEENRAAIEAFNRYCERDGSIADDYRTF